MKILNIEQIKLDEDKIKVTVAEYPHAQPVFNANISKEDLEVALKEWEQNQIEVDAINAEAISEVKVEPVVKAELTSLIGKVIK